MTTVRLTAPAREPVTRAMARAHLRIDHPEDDALLDRLVAAGRAHVEQATRRALIRQSWRYYLDCWPAGRVARLPIAPVMSVDEITIYDADGAPHMLSSEDYVSDVASVPARVKAHAGRGTPGSPLNGIEIDFTAGYGTAPEAIPETLQQAILLLVGHWYEHREASDPAMAQSIPLGFDMLIANQRVPRL